MKNIENIYPLTPLQQGMLFHTLYAPESGMYFEQIVYALHGDLNVSAFTRAWQRVVDRHPALRTAFLWEDLDKPIQVVYRQEQLPLEQQDSRGLSLVEQQTRLEAHLKEDRRRGFELSEAPLTRLALIQDAEDAYHFIWSFHHLLLDRWSSSLVLKEVFTFYKSFNRGQDLHLETSRPFQDYIAWLRQQSLSEAEEYWRRTLKGFTAPTALGVDLAPGSLPDQEDVYDEQQIKLSVATTSALQSLARRHRLTLNTIMQGAWALLLSRYSGEEDVVSGATVSGRPATLPGVESMVGLFINTLPVRVQVRPGDSLLLWLKRLQDQLVELRQYEHSPLVDVQGWTEMSRGLPLFESILVFENISVDESSWELGRSLEIRTVRSIGWTNYPLTVLAVPGSELTLQIKYNCRRFDAAAVSCMLGHLQTLLEGIVVDREQRLSALPLLTEAEWHHLIMDLNDTRVDYPKDSCLHQLFESQVERSPDAVAVVFEDQQLTYRELNARANQLARCLGARGVGPEVLVGICIERSMEMVIGLLGILKAGGAYVPLDPAFPRERLAFMHEDAQAPVVLTQQRLLGVLPTDRAHVICLDKDWKAIAQENEENMAIGLTADNAAYVIYTSGSTGSPKGVLVEQKQVLNYVKGIEDRLKLVPGVSFAMVQPLAVDSCITMIFPSLFTGGCLHVVSEERAVDPEGLCEYFCRYPIDCLKIAPSHLAALQTSPQKEQILPHRWLVVGGEASRWDWLGHLQSMAPELTIFNHYGPTEATVGMLTYRVKNGQNTHKSSLVPLGHPLPNTQAYLMDGNLTPVPIGISSELHIGGACLARGYLNHPEVTAEKFIPNPFSREPGARLYKTGDLARYSRDRNIEFVGRTDYQVKIRGFRVELGEIEAVLGQHRAVREIVVLAREDEPGDPSAPLRTGKRLVAYVVTEHEHELTSSELRHFLQEKLPAYMAPSRFVMVANLPRTPHGKVDRRSLPPPDTYDPESEETFVPPCNPVEKAVAGIWSEVLGVQRVGLHDNFFELGGHSLLATQVISRVRQTFQVELPIRTLFETPTVAGLAESVETVRRKEQGLQALPILPVSRDADLPLSFAQQRLWFLDQLDPGSSVYNVPVAIRLNGSLNVTALERSFNEIIRRHEVLRTTFAVVDGQPLQVITTTLVLNLPTVDLRGLPETEREMEFQRLASEEAQRPFDLTQGPLSRTTLLQLGEEQYIVLLTRHHIITDHWSINILFRELSILYEAFASGKPSPLSELPIQYADFAVWQRQQLQSEFLETQLSYWKKQLSGAPAVLELPTDRPRPPVQNHRGALQTLQLSKTVTKALQAISQREGTTLFMTLLTAFNILLHRYTGQKDIIVGTPIAGRNRAEIEGLIGFFLNNLVIRTDLSGSPTFREMLARLRQVALDAYAHQDLPFEKLLEELEVERDLSRTPLFQIFFNMLNLEAHDLQLPGLIVEHLSLGNPEARFDLTLYVSELNEGISLALVYNIDLFDRQRMVEMLDQFRHLLSQIVENPDQKIACFSLLTPTAGKLLPNPTQLLHSEWVGAVHNHFSQQAQQLPEHPAILDQHDSWTYHELDLRSNQLANYLLESGIQSQDIVAIYGHRSASLIWALLGILKAGGAFVILDPEYPTARLIDYLRVTQLHGFIQVEAAGELPDALEAFIDTIGCNCRVVLPQHSSLTQNFLGAYSADDPQIMIGRDDLAYVAFTSGSTGKPNGVQGRHGPLSHFLPWQAETFGLSGTDRFSMLSGLSHDPLQRDIFTSLWVGATICIPDPIVIATPGRLADWMEQEKITFTHLTPAIGEILTETAAANCRLRSLRYAFFVGDKLSRRDVARLCNLAPNITCVNSYGSTETQRAVSYYLPLPEREETQARSIYPLGRGMPNVQLLVLNANHRLAGIGELGEIYVRSPHLAAGYLGDKLLTQARFLTNPFTEVDSDRLYKTGDLGRYLPDGNVEFLGRADRQVKIRGFRIEPGEIEAVLSQHPALKQSVVLAREDVPGDPSTPLSTGKRLVAYIVSRQEPAPTIGELHGFLHEKLPEYMVPSVFVWLEALPLTPNGKVDLRALPEPESTRPKLEESFVAPSTAVEEVMAGIWSKVLGVQQVGLHDNFFELGGHSLLAIQVTSWLNDAFSVELPLRNLFESPTIAGIADAISRVCGGREVAEVIARTWQELEQLSEEHILEM